MKRDYVDVFRRAAGVPVGPGFGHDIDLIADITMPLVEDLRLVIEPGECLSASIVLFGTPEQVQAAEERLMDAGFHVKCDQSLDVPR